MTKYTFDEKEPEIGEIVSFVWEDGSNCECIYYPLDKTILPLPTHWYYVNKQQDHDRR
jgi:hypothetical protein